MGQQRPHQIIKFLSKSQLDNVEAIYQEYKKSTIKNPLALAGIFAVVSKETCFVLTQEIGYNTTELPRIKNIFGNQLSKLKDNQIESLKLSPEEWFDYLYGGKFGNSTSFRQYKKLPGYNYREKVDPYIYDGEIVFKDGRGNRSEGFKFRGRGFNGLTFRGVYAQYAASLGVDIVRDPDQLMKKEVGARALLQYFLTNYKIKSQYGPILVQWGIPSNNINDVTNLQSAIGCAFHVTGGPYMSKDKALNMAKTIGAANGVTIWDKMNDFAAEWYEWILKREGKKLPETIPLTAPTGATPSGATPSGATPSDSQSAVDPNTGTVAQENSRGDVQGQSPSTEKQQLNPRFITQILEPKLKGGEIRVTLNNQEDFKREVAKNFGYLPVIYYGSYQIEYRDIEFFQLFTQNNLPTIKLVFRDTLSLMKDKAFPMDDTKIILFINPRSNQLKPIHMTFKINSFLVKGKVYTLTATVDSNALYIKKFKSFSSKSSFNVFKQIAEETGLGFASNIDDTNDSMTWINPGKSYADYIDDVVNNSYKSDETYLTCYVDYYYNLTYIDVEKELKRDIREELGIGNIGLHEILKEDKELVNKLVLTNNMAFRSSNVYFKEHKILNNSTSVSLSDGYSTRVKYYDELKKDFLVFKMDSITSDAESKIILKGAPQDEEFYKENVTNVYIGKLDGDNMYANFHYSSMQNYKNLTDLSKIGLEVTMKTPNFNFYKYQKVLVIISSSTPTPANSIVNNRLSGEWLIVDIMFRIDKGSLDQVIKLVKRELELSPDEAKAETPSPLAKKDSGRGSSPNPETASQESAVAQETSSQTPPAPTTPGQPAPSASQRKYQIIKYLGKVQMDNAEAIYQEYKKSTIKNPLALAGIFAVVSKETAFTLTEEFGYSTTGLERIKNIFGVQLSELSNSQIERLKLNVEEWFDYLYGGKFGNSQSVRVFSSLAAKNFNNRYMRSEGFKYRGRGFNGLTFKGVYDQYTSLIGVDITRDPQQLMKKEVGAKALLSYFLTNYKISSKYGPILKQWGIASNNINDVNNFQSAVGPAFHVTGGPYMSQPQALNFAKTIGAANGVTIWDKMQDYAAEWYEWILKREGQKVPETLPPAR